MRVSRDGGRTFGKRVELFETRNEKGIGVPAVAIGNDVIAVAWTNRANGRVKVSTSRDDGRTFVDEHGKPFLFLGDTAWELGHRLTRADAETYLRTRRDQGLVDIDVFGGWIPP